MTSNPTQPISRGESARLESSKERDDPRADAVTGGTEVFDLFEKEWSSEAFADETSKGIGRDCDNSVNFTRFSFRSKVFEFHGFLSPS